MLLKALHKEGLWTDVPIGKDHGLPPFNAELRQAIYAFLARTPSFLLTVPLEDLLGEVETPNIPGASHRDYPVWKMKAGPKDSWLHEWRNSPDIAALAKTINQERNQ